MNVLRIAVLLLTVSVVVSRAEDTNTLPTTITVDGEKYEDVQWGTVTPSAVSIRHKTGIAKILLAKLPPDLQRRFGYDPQKAAEYRTQEMAAQEKIRKADAEAAARRRQEKEAAAQQEARQDPTNAITASVKDIKNFPNEYLGKTVKVDCNILNFERIQTDGPLYNNFQLSAEGVSVQGVRNGDNPYHPGDGIWLSGFFIVPKEAVEIVDACHKIIDGNAKYFSTVYARMIRPHGEKRYLGVVFRIEFTHADGSPFMTAKSDAELKLGADEQ